MPSIEWLGLFVGKVFELGGILSAGNDQMVRIIHGGGLETSPNSNSPWGDHISAPVQ